MLKDPKEPVSLKTFIIPALDIIDGKCVRLAEGDFNRKTEYPNEPLTIARAFEEAGLKRLHLVDLDGAKSGRVVNWKVLEELASQTSLEIDFGGGIKREDDVAAVFEAGARYVTVGSMAVKQEEILLEWLGKYGAENFLIGADVRDGKIAVGGWLESTEIRLFDFLSRYLGHGVNHFFCTDISKDGKLEGPSLELYRKVLSAFPGLRLIASGGVRSLEDIRLLKETGCDAAIVGKAIYEGRIRIEELSNL